MKKIIFKINFRKNALFCFKKICEGRDSNPRTPMRLGPQPSAFNQAWQPSHSEPLKSAYSIKHSVVLYFSI